METYYEKKKKMPTKLTNLADNGFSLQADRLSARGSQLPHTSCGGYGEFP
jgi:hypothetical protein